MNEDRDLDRSARYTRHTHTHTQIHTHDTHTHTRTHARTHTRHTHTHTHTPANPTYTHTQTHTHKTTSCPLTLLTKQNRKFPFFGRGGKSANVSLGGHVSDSIR